jgi:hypothetical protein
MSTNDNRTGPVRSEVQTKQGGRSPLTLWVLCGSLVLAAIVAYFLLTQTNLIAPNRPNAVTNPANPGAPAAQQEKSNP